MSTSAAAETAIRVEERNPVEDRGKAPAAAMPAPASTARKAPLAFLFQRTKGGAGWKRGVGCFDFILRICGIAATIVAAVTMGTTNETLPFYTEHFQFHADYSDLPGLTFFVVGNAIAAGYLVLSIPFSIICMIRPHALCPRFLLFLMDTVMFGFTTAAASSATAIVNLAHDGAEKPNWIAICLRFDGFCQRISAAVVASFVGVAFFLVLVFMSALIMRKR